MSIKLVVFDMAGTTVSDENYVALSFQQAMKKQGYEVELKDVNPLMGYEKPVAIQMMLQKCETDVQKINTAIITQIHADFVNIMLEFYTRSNEIKPLPNVENTFEQLRNMGIKIGLDTGFSRNIAELIISRLNWEDKIDIMVASDDVKNGRPYPDMIHKMKMDLNILPTDGVIKIGDTEVDINEGLNADCNYVIGITTGAFTRAELEPHHPTHIIDDISELIAIIKA
ncbi:Putative phosphonatase-like hydrolase [Pedobacter cryoconitis]|uniref:Putative phosphonatase-like hydrolase n=1 Tax=Pedobacter cryoconitis TaxID=188932 RepID=A0A127VK00_9SPHI|nr:HAD hydrolase-like protein [Pedobacter cryoconitis]AMQ01637.1 Putative phosphonatase-like hydrolase [Pedobacter cryoconitis]